MKRSFSAVLPLIALLLCASHAHAKPKPQAAIDSLIGRGAWTTEAVLAPLDAKLPPSKRPSRLRSDIMALRVKLLGEAAKSPAASPDAYKVALGLCDAWLGALDERDKSSATISRTPMATTDMESSKAVNPGPVQQDQEAIDAQKKKQEDAKQNAYFNDAQKKQWLQRCAQLRPNIEQFLTQLGALRTQRVKPGTAAASPAGT